MTKLLKRLAKRGEVQRVDLAFRPANQFELKEMGGDIPDGYVAGWASTPGIDLYRHVVATGAFDDSIRTRGLTGPKSIKLLIGHDRDKVAGVIKVLETRNGALWIEAQINLNTSYGRDAYEAAKMAGGLNFSVGFVLQDYEFKEDDNGNEYVLISRGDLIEVSIVPFPGNEDATMEFIKGRDFSDGEPFDTIASFEKALVANGLAKSRNEARRITQEVKRAAHLFQGAGDDPASDPAPTKPAPMLATSDIQKLSSLTAKMREILAL